MPEEIEHEGACCTTECAECGDPVCVHEGGYEHAWSGSYEPHPCLREGCGCKSFVDMSA